jgi:curved DNA-binding protein CbpA
MSSDEPVEDPYLALGVAKDADIAAIRSAHRKLVLKYHPDRLKGEEEQARGKDAFQKVQQAYELLSDPTTRARYDNRVKLAQMKKEAMARDPPPRTTAYPMRPPPPSTPNREYRDGRIYEERTPNTSYFEEGYRYREEEPRTTSRKYDGYERERRADFGQPEKERKSTRWPEKTASGLSFNSALKFKVKAQKAKETVKEKTREKEIHASSAKSRDRDHRSARMDKQSSRRAYVEDDYSSSDSDTATYVTINRPSPSRPSKSPYDSTPRPRSKPEPPRRSTSTLDEEDEDDDKWRPIHGNAIEYIGRSTRPGLSGRSISSRTYWGES